MFKDIRAGKTEISISNKPYYIKHLGVEETSIMEDFYEEVYSEALKVGRLSKKQILDDCVKNGLWTETDEDSLFNLSRDIRVFTEKRNSVPGSVQELWALNDEIKNMTDLISKLESKKMALCSDSAEAYAETRTIEKRIHLSMFDDCDLTKKSFSEEDLNYIEDDFYNTILREYVVFLKDFSIDRIKLLSVRKFAQSLFAITQDEFKIFDRPIIDLTVFQISFLRNGKYYRSLLDEIRAIDDDDITNPERIEEVFLESKIPKKEKKLVK